jgi:hypothetical protein
MGCENSMRGDEEGRNDDEKSVTRGKRVSVVSRQEGEAG